ncbi:MAG: 50S ribosomal protein L25 [Thermodesulfobacteriota bacterium]|nr:50S ribosomal protein L25 [Thermodesulfobacteriota bacterium]
MKQLVLTARVRENKGKGAARKLRRNNQIPAIFYGPESKPVMLVVDYPELKHIIKQGTGENMILDLEIQSDSATDTKKVTIKDLLFDPVKDTFLHADFYEISMDREITLPVSIHLINTPIGVTNGGILQHIRRELTISCLPDKLVNFLEIDVSGLDIGDSVHIRDIELPDGITSTEDTHLTVAVLAAPTVKEEEEEAEAIEEGIEEAEESESAAESAGE